MIILKILLFILKAVLIILAFVVLLLCIPVFVKIRYDEELSVRIRLLFLPVDVYPKEKLENNKLIVFFKKISKKLPKKKKKKPEKEEEKSPREGKAKKEKSALSELVEQKGFSGAVGLFLEIARLAVSSVGKIFAGMIIDRFDLDVRISSPDAYDTALSYGKWCAVLYPAASAILGSVARYKQNISVTSDFKHQESRFDADVRLHFYPIALVFVSVGFLARLLWRQIKETVKEKMAENMQ